MFVPLIYIYIHNALPCRGVRDMFSSMDFWINALDVRSLHVIQSSYGRHQPSVHDPDSFDQVQMLCTGKKKQTLDVLASKKA